MSNLALSARGGLLVIGNLPALLMALIGVLLTSFITPDGGSSSAIDSFTLVPNPKIDMLYLFL